MAKKTPAKKESSPEELQAKDKTLSLPERMAALKSSIKKKYGNVSFDPVGVKFTPTFIPSVDYALGGGFANGRVIEVLGMESSGKTSLIIHVCGVAQWLNPEKYIVILDHEHTFDPNWARKLGLNPDRIIPLQPETAEDSMNMMIQDLSINKDIAGVLIDSVAAMETKAQREKQLGENTVGALARCMSEGLRKLVTVTPADGPFYAFLNQIRMKVGQTGGSPETSPGGNALKFYASQRFDTRRDTIEEASGDGESPEFNKIRGNVKKNKVAPPFRKVNSDSFLINYNSGFDFAMSFIFMYKIARPKSISHAWIGVTMPDGTEQRFQGAAQLKKAFWENRDMRNSLMKIVMDHYNSFPNPPAWDYDLYVKYYDHLATRDIRDDSPETGIAEGGLI